VYKTVGLDEESYRLLAAAKRPGESFSDVVRRLTSPSGDWRSLVGILGDDGERMANWLREHRDAERALARSKWKGPA
jgi:predicted CopG family antitoxin